MKAKFVLCVISVVAALMTFEANAGTAVVSKQLIWKTTEEYKRLKESERNALKENEKSGDLQKIYTESGAALMRLKERVSQEVDKSLKDLGYDKVIDLSSPEVDSETRKLSIDSQLYLELLRRVDAALAASSQSAGVDETGK